MTLTFPWRLGIDEFGTTAWNMGSGDLRELTDITTADLTAAQIEDLIYLAGPKFNADASVKIIEEKVEYIDEYRQNKRDGVNTTYWVKKSLDWWLGDLNDDGLVNTSDLEVWAYDNSSNTKTQQTITAVDEAGSFTIFSAPSSNTTLTVTYRYMPCKMSDLKVKRAVTELVAAFCYSKLEARELKSISLGRLKVQRTPIGVQVYLKSYEQTLSEINARQLLRKQTGVIKIPDLPVLDAVADYTTGTGGFLT
jgi:hypothetical protein